MSVNQKQISAKIAKIAAGILMAFLIIFNLQVSYSGDNNKEGLDLLGVKVTSFVADAYATEYGTMWRKTQTRVMFDEWGLVPFYRCDKVTYEPQCIPFETGWGF